MAIFSPSESPAIVVKETDLTGGVPNVQTTTGAFCGNFRWGPINQATLIDNEASLADKFGTPDDTYAVDFHTASSFLRYSNQLFVVRAANLDSAVNAADASAVLIRNDDHFDTLTPSGKVYARCAGTLGNSIKVVSAGPTTWTGWTASYKAEFDAAPTGNEIHVLVLDEDGTITGTANQVLERYAYVSTSSSATNADGTTNYVKEVINKKSGFIYATTNFVDSNLDASLTGGINGSIATTGQIATGWDEFNDKDNIEVDFLIANNQSSNSNQATVMNDLITTASSLRKDCVAVSSPAATDIVGNSSANANAVTFSESVTYSSYGIIDNNHIKVYDKFNDKFIHIPAAGSTAGIMAASDNSTGSWFSPAGPRRGAYLGATSLAYSPDKSERDTLYKASINPIANLPGQGILLFGDKTHMNRPSAFDRINVRRLFLVVERAIAVAARNTMFEFNDEFTRAEFVNIVEPFLREIKGRRGITDFRVVCDATNNTAAVIDRNEFIANIFIKPARSINYITLNFVAVRSGVDFEEVAGLPTV